MQPHSLLRLPRVPASSELRSASSVFGCARALVVFLSEDIRRHVCSNRALDMHLSLAGDILCSMGFGPVWLADSVVFFDPS